MFKTEAIELLGGSAAIAADMMGVTYQAVNKWPHVLPLRISDRVLGVCVRKGREIPARFVDQEAPPAITGKAQSAINSEARQPAQEGAHA